MTDLLRKVLYRVYVCVCVSVYFVCLTYSADRRRSLCRQRTAFAQTAKTLAAAKTLSLNCKDKYAEDAFSLHFDRLPAVLLRRKGFHLCMTTQKSCRLARVARVDLDQIFVRVCFLCFSSDLRVYYISIHFNPFLPFLSLF